MVYDLFVLLVEKLEWEFGNEWQRENVLFSNGNKSIKSIFDMVVIELLSDRDNSAHESKWIVKLLKGKPRVISVSGGGRKKSIGYYDYNGLITDSGERIKNVEELKEGDEVHIKNKLIKELQNKEYIYELKVIKNNDLVISTLYQDSNKRQLSLCLAKGNEVEVEVFGKIFNKMFNHN